VVDETPGPDQPATEVGQQPTDDRVASERHFAALEQLE
jgi:hypothetical protein